MYILYTEGRSVSPRAIPKAIVRSGAGEKSTLWVGSGHSRCLPVLPGLLLSIRLWLRAYESTA